MASRVSKRLEFILSTKEEGAALQSKFLKRMQNLKERYKDLNKELKENKNLSDKEKARLTTITKAMKAYEAQMKKTLALDKKRQQLGAKLLKIDQKVAAAQEKLASGKGLGPGGRAGYIKNVLNPLKKELRNVEKEFKEVDEATRRNIDTSRKLKRALEQLENQTKDNTNWNDKNTNSNNQNTNSNNRNTNSVNKKERAMEKFGQRVKTVEGSLRRRLGALRNQILVLTFAFGTFIAALKSAFEEARKTESALRGLGAVAMNVGISVSTATDAARSLAQDGLMTVMEASAGLKNLLAAGLDLPKAINLMKAFKDSAAFGRQGTLGFGEAIVGATQGVKNMNSIMVDNAGITKNLSLMYKDYAAQLGTTEGKLTDAQKVEAAYQGIMKESLVYNGDAARALETTEGAMLRLNAQVRSAKVSFGEAMKPAMEEVIGVIYKMVESFNDWVRANKDMLTDRLAVWGKNAAVILKALGFIMSTLAPILGFLTSAVGRLFISFMGARAVIKLWTTMRASTVLFNKSLKGLGVTTIWGAKAWTFYTASGKKTYGIMRLLSSAFTLNGKAVAVMTAKMAQLIHMERKHLLAMKANNTITALGTLKLKALTWMQNFFIKMSRQAAAAAKAFAGSLTMTGYAANFAKLALVGVKVAAMALATKLLPLLALMAAFEAVMWIWQSISDWFQRDNYIAEGMSAINEAANAMNYQIAESVVAVERLMITGSKFGIDSSAAMGELDALKAYADRIRAMEKEALAIRNEDDIQALKDKIDIEKNLYDEQYNSFKEKQVKIEEDTRNHLNRLTNLEEAYTEANTTLYEVSEDSRQRKIGDALKALNKSYNEFFDQFSQTQIDQNDYLLNKQEYYQKKRLELEEAFNERIEERRRELHAKLALMQEEETRILGQTLLTGTTLDQWARTAKQTEEFTKLQAVIDKANAEIAKHQDAVNNQQLALNETFADTKKAIGDISDEFELYGKSLKGQIKTINDALVDEFDWSMRILFWATSGHESLEASYEEIESYVSKLKTGIDSTFTAWEKGERTVKRFDTLLDNSAFGKELKGMNTQIQSLQTTIDTMADDDPLKQFFINSKNAFVDFYENIKVLPEQARKYIREYEDGKITLDDLNQKLREETEIINNNVEGERIKYNQLKKRLELEKEVREEEHAQLVENDKYNRQILWHRNKSFSLLNKEFTMKTSSLEGLDKEINLLKQRNTIIDSSIQKVRNVVSELEKEGYMTPELKKNYDEIVKSLEKERGVHILNIKQLQDHRKFQGDILDAEKEYIQALEIVNRQLEKVTVTMQARQSYQSKLAGMTGNQIVQNYVTQAHAVEKIKNEEQKLLKVMTAKNNYLTKLKALTTDTETKTAIQNQINWNKEELQRQKNLFAIKKKYLNLEKEIADLQAKLAQDKKKIAEDEKVSLAKGQDAYDKQLSIASLLLDKETQISLQHEKRINKLDSEQKVKNKILAKEIVFLQKLMEKYPKIAKLIKEEINLKKKQNEREKEIVKSTKEKLYVEEQVAIAMANVNELQRKANIEAKNAQIVRKGTLKADMVYLNFLGATRTARKRNYQNERKEIAAQYNLKIKMLTIEKLQLKALKTKLQAENKLTTSMANLIDLRISELNIESQTLRTTMNKALYSAKQVEDAHLVLDAKKKDLALLEKQLQVAADLNKIYGTLDDPEATRKRLTGKKKGEEKTQLVGTTQDWFGIAGDWWRGLGFGDFKESPEYKADLAAQKELFLLDEKIALQKAQELAKSDPTNKIFTDAVKEKQEELDIAKELWTEEEKRIAAQEQVNHLMKKQKTLMDGALYVSKAISSAYAKQAEIQREYENEVFRLQKRHELGLISQEEMTKRMEFAARKRKATEKLERAKSHAEMLQQMMEAIGLELIKGGVARLVTIRKSDDAAGVAMLAAGMAMTSLGASIGQKVFGSKIQAQEQEMIAIEEEMAAWEAAQNAQTDEGGAKQGKRSFGGTVRAEQLTVNITPTMVISGEQVFIGSGSVQEFSDVIANNMIGNIQQSIESGELDFSQVANSADNTSTNG